MIHFLLETIITIHYKNFKDYRGLKTVGKCKKKDWNVKFSAALSLLDNQLLQTVSAAKNRRICALDNLWCQKSPEI
jgi:hypothetical protein